MSQLILHALHNYLVYTACYLRATRRQYGLTGSDRSIRSNQEVFGRESLQGKLNEKDVELIDSKSKSKY